MEKIPCSNLLIGYYQEYIRTYHNILNPFELLLAPNDADIIKKLPSNKRVFKQLKTCLEPIYLNKDNLFYASENNLFDVLNKMAEIYKLKALIIINWKTLTCSPQLKLIFKAILNEIPS